MYDCDPTKHPYCPKRDCFITGGKCALTSFKWAATSDSRSVPQEGRKLTLIQRRLRRAFRQGKLEVAFPKKKN